MNRVKSGLDPGYSETNLSLKRVVYYKTLYSMSMELETSNETKENVIFENMSTQLDLKSLKLNASSNMKTKIVYNLIINQ